MVVNSNSIKDLARQMNELIKNVPMQMKRINEELVMCDQEIGDILHMIELSSFHASDGYKLAKDIQITRRKRRELKDELTALTAVNVTMNRHQPLLMQTEILTTTINQEHGRQKGRKYTPRIRTDFAERFKHLESIK